MNQNLMIWLWIFIFLITFVLASIFYGSEDPSIYVEAYRPTIEQSKKRHADLKRRSTPKYNRNNQQRSNEPTAPGLRESDIKKKQGDRYQTF